MDTTSSLGSQQLGQIVENLSDKEKQELQQVFLNEAQKAKIQETVHGLTEVCWKKCVTGKISAAYLDRNEESCMKNCVDRFMDGNFAVLKHLQSMRTGSLGQ